MVYCPLLKMDIDPVDCMEIEYRKHPQIYDRLNVSFTEEESEKICKPHRESNYKDPRTTP